MKKTLVFLSLLALSGAYLLMLSRSDNGVSTIVSAIKKTEPENGNPTYELLSQFNGKEDVQTAESIGNARDQQVRQKLKNFLDRTNSISAETIKKERFRIAEAFENASNKPTEMPLVSNIIDENEQAWIRLQFSDGIVRYAFKGHE